MSADCFFKINISIKNYFSDTIRVSNSFSPDQARQNVGPDLSPKQFAKVLFVYFVALHPKSTAMVMAGRSVQLTTLFFLGKLEHAVNQYFVHILSLLTDNNPS